MPRPGPGIADGARQDPAPAAADPARGGLLSFDEIYDDHVERVARTLRRLGVTPAALDDAIQDVFIVVHRRLAEFREGGALRAWLHGIVVNVARDYLRGWRRWRARFVASSDDLDEAPDVGPAGFPRATPEQLAMRRQARLRLAAILDRLPERQRTVFVLVDLEQLTLQEAGAILRVSLSTAHSRLMAARARVNEEVERLRADEAEEGRG